ncbi:DUF2088 domain-containing protein [candidate division KSB3 bacterium]|uniref:DUF2088 domain-containing protein n=1 Tax=candidate division KSB3 bacterium TaxID=2044937 RepID=A0A2G6E515_9BACT|nr:MAG: DUF2088 domain-containing protein [candidate division KSB3 bacterium]PIE29827.1 MAG: DUF2088 domain-containing protein [candidate division KSB3 bacterium]
MKLLKIKQHFERDQINDEQLESLVRERIIQSGITLKAGATVAIAVGSRGIANLQRIVKATAQTVKELGGEPFIVPAMGSHGGATAEGQQEVLETYGVTEAYTSAPIRSSMEVVELPQDDLDNKVYMDAQAYQAEATIIINRVKLHTDFHGPVESGLMKMCVIGLGKHTQALEIHSYGVRGLKELMPMTARQILQHGNIILGIALAENAYDETAIIRALRPSEIESGEMALLEWVRGHMPQLPIDRLDVLIVDEFGKDISGSGMDTNIIGRIKIRGEQEPNSPKIRNIIVLDLTDASHGNAVGMGLADLVTRKFYEKIDFKATYENTLTSNFLERGKLPIVAENEQLALQYALRNCGIKDPAAAKIIKIKNTLTLDEMWVSPAVMAELEGRQNIEMTHDMLELL